MANTTFLNAIPPRLSLGNAMPPGRADESGPQKAGLQPIGGTQPKLFYELYGILENPFGVTPNPRYLYQSGTHAEARSSLIIGIECRVGFQALIAPPGMGKTTILFNLLERFNNVARTAFLFQTHGDSRDFLRYLISELGGEAPDSDLVRMQDTINHMLIREHRAGRQTIVIIDEAQNLDTSVLETLRLLSNFETPTEKLLQIILAGQPQLAQRLATPEVAQLHQRISILATLVPFGLEDTRDYIEHRLKIAGYKGPPLFTPAALRLILERSGGVPREINTLCFNALLLATAVEEKRVDSDVLHEVVADLDLNPIVFNKDKFSRGIRGVQAAEVPRLEGAAADPPATSIDETCKAAVPGATDNIVACAAPPDRPALTNTRADRAILAQLSVPPRTTEEPDNRAERIASEHRFTNLLASAYALQQTHDRIRLRAGATKFSEILAEVIDTQSLIRNCMLHSDSAMYLVAHRTQRLSGAAGAAIGLLYREKLDYRAGTGIAASLLGFKIREDKSVSFGSVKSGQLAETDTSQDPELAGRVVAKSVLSAPVYQNGKLAGCIQLFSRVGEFGQDATHACELMSHVVNLLISASGAPQSGERDSQASIPEIQKQFEDTRTRRGIEEPASLREADAPQEHSDHKTDVVTFATGGVVGLPNCETEAAGNSLDIPPSFTPEAIDASGAKLTSPPSLREADALDYALEHSDHKTDVVTFAAGGVIGLPNCETEAAGNSLDIPPSFTPEAIDAPGAKLVSPLIRTLNLLNDATTTPRQKWPILHNWPWISAIAALAIVSSFALGLMIRSLGKRNSELPSISRIETAPEPRTARIPEVARKHRHTTTESSARETIADDKPAPGTAVDKAPGRLPNVDNIPTTEDNAASVLGSLTSSARAAGADSRAVNSTPETTTESSARETVVDEAPAPGTAVDKSGKLPNVDTVPNAEEADSVSESVMSSVPAAGVGTQAGLVENIVPARLIRKVKPIYPAAAVKAQIQGSVVLQVLVDKNGAVRDVRSISGPSILAPAAIDAVEHSRFRPCNLNGQPLESEALVTVKFSLR